MARGAADHPRWPALVFTAGDPDGTDIEGGVSVGSAPDGLDPYVDGPLLARCFAVL